MSGTRRPEVLFCPVTREINRHYLAFFFLGGAGSVVRGSKEQVTLVYQLFYLKDMIVIHLGI